MGRETFGGSTVVEPEVKPETETEFQSKSQESPNYAVILFDDDTHSYAYVVEMMMTLFAMTAQQSFDIAYEVDHVGQATVKICPLVEAKESLHKILNYGPDHRMDNSNGSMGACIEPVS
ncbi:MAG: ATP-dependent Clp protease adaptor ClpS [Sumerlaeia bacterium]